METQDFNKKLMDYLYGEMEPGEKIEFEEKLSEDEDLRKEYETLSSVRQELDILKDKEVMESFSTWRKPRSPYWFGEGSKRKMVVFRPITAVAASLVILMLFGYLTNFSVSLNEQGLLLGFGNQARASEENFLREDEVKALVRDELDNNNRMLQTKFNEAENTYNNKFMAMETSLSNAINTNKNTVVTSEDLQKFFTEAESQNSELMRDYLQLTTAQQQEYFKTMFIQFDELMQERRNEDLTIIRNSLIDLKQSQYIQKQETDNVLASLISTVNQNKN